MDTQTIINLWLAIISTFLAAISVVTVVITLRQNNKMIEESIRPVISVYSAETNFNTPILYLVVKNTGHSSACIKTFSYDAELRGCYRRPFDDKKDYLQELNNSTLAPGQSRICMLDYNKIHKPVTFNVVYGYSENSLKKEYKETFTIDIKAAVSMPYGKAENRDDELHVISYTLQEMVQKNL